MGVQSLLSRLSTNVFVPSLKDFKGSLFDTSTSCCIGHAKWSSYNKCLASCKIGSNRRQFLSAVKSQKVEDFSAESGQHNLKPRRKRLAVFVSGGGSNFKAIHAAILNGSIHGDVVVLITNKGTKEEQQLSPTELVTTLREYKVDYVLLAGYLKLIPTELVQHYPKRILNIHPSLLPAFGGKGYYGLKVHKAVIASGARYSGPTIHYVDEEYDTGRILAQGIVPVCPFDTPEELAARVLHEEHQLYVDVVSALCEDRIIWRDDGVPLIQSKEDPHQYS